MQLAPESLSCKPSLILELTQLASALPLQIVAFRLILCLEMDIGSTNIDSRWRICTLASFLGVVLLVLLLKQGHVSVDLSSPRSSAVLVASSIDLFPSPTNQSSNSLSFKESRELEHKEQKGCDIFDGKWIYNPKASPLYNGAQCPFLSNQVSCQKNGRPDSQYERWSWEANRCAIPRLAVTSFKFLCMT